MSVRTRDPAPALEHVVAAALRRTGERRRVVAVERAPFERASWWAAEVVTVRYADGERLRLFLKDLSIRRYGDPDVAERREREIRVHAEVLPRLDLGTPRHLGAVRDGDRCWLLLEYVDALPVKWHGFPVWLEAAAWLGRLQARVAAVPAVLADTGPVRPLSADHHRRTAEAAISAAAAFAPTLGRRVERALRNHPEVVAAMLAAPRTLVHGGYRPQNILWRGPGAAEPICPVDWEEAAVGPTAYDLAHLVDGFDDRRRRELVDAYCAAATRWERPTDDREGFARVLDACALQKDLGTLAKAVDRDFPAASVDRLVAMVEVAAARADGHPPRPAVPDGARVPPAPPTTPGPGGDGLRADLERILSCRRGTPVHVRALAVEPSPYAGRAPADVVRVVLDGDRDVTVFVKHPAPDDGHPDKRRRDRERRVHEDLLGHAEGLPVVPLLGVVATGGARPSLVFPHVADGDLRYHDLGVWRTAAAALGRLHRHFGGHPGLDAVGALLRLDATYLGSWADRATLAVGRRSVTLGRRLERVQHGFGEVVAPLEGCLSTLVHNDLAPKNVMVDRATNPASIGITDWEVAGVGCGVLDLVHLCHGLGPADARRMLDVYRGVVAGSGLLPDDDRDVARVAAACRIHTTLHRLAHVDGLGVPPATVDDWVEEVVRLRRGL